MSNLLTEFENGFVVAETETDKISREIQSALFKQGYTWRGDIRQLKKFSEKIIACQDAVIACYSHVDGSCVGVLTATIVMKSITLSYVKVLYGQELIHAISS